MKIKKLLLILLSFMVIMEQAFMPVSVFASQKGFIKKKGITYFYKEDGKVLTGLKRIGLNTYYFAPVRKTGQKKGAMQTGWTRVKGQYRFFDRHNGQMVRGITVDGVYIKENGVASINVINKKIILKQIKAKNLVGQITNIQDKVRFKVQKCKKYIDTTDNLKDTLTALDINFDANDIDTVNGLMENGEYAKISDLAKTDFTFEDEQVAKSVENVVKKQNEVMETLKIECGEDSLSFNSGRKVNLKKPVINGKKAYADSRIKIAWIDVAGADYYLVFKKLRRARGYDLVKKTNKHVFTDEDCKPLKSYTYKVVAVSKEKKLSNRCKSVSKAITIRSRMKSGKAAYLGDSVMTGFSIYNLIDHEKEQSFAKIGLSVHTLNNSGLTEEMAYGADRYYIMIGTNDCVGNRSIENIQSSVDAYISVCKKLHKNNPDVEIVAMGIGPTRSDRVPMRNVNLYNSRLKKAASHLDYVRFFNTAKYLKGDDGQLKSEYAAGDGIHWSTAAYQFVKEKLNEFVK